MSHAAWKKLKEVIAYQNWRVIKLATFELPDGQPYDFDIMDDPPAASVLAFTENGRVILAKQFRPGPKKFLLELPGGVIDESEAPDAAAARELLEETGYAGELIAVGTHLHDAYSTRVVHDFVATHCRRISEPHADGREPIEVVLMPLDEFRAHLKQGQFSDIASGFLGLAYLGLL